MGEALVKHVNHPIRNCHAALCQGQFLGGVKGLPYCFLCAANGLIGTELAGTLEGKFEPVTPLSSGRRHVKIYPDVGTKDS
jgi:hypothetical protein